MNTKNLEQAKEEIDKYFSNTSDEQLLADLKKVDYTKYKDIKPIESALEGESFEWKLQLEQLNSLFNKLNSSKSIAKTYTADIERNNCLRILNRKAIIGNLEITSPVTFNMHNSREQTSVRMGVAIGQKIAMKEAIVFDAVDNELIRSKAEKSDIRKQLPSPLGFRKSAKVYAVKKKAAKGVRMFDPPANKKNVLKELGVVVSHTSVAARKRSLTKAAALKTKAEKTYARTI